MPYYYRFLLLLLISWSLSASAQQIDQTFRADVLRYSNVASMAVLPSGHLLVLGDQLYTNGLLTGSLVRFGPSGAFDELFAQRSTLVSCTVDAYGPYRPLVRAYPDGRLLLVGAVTQQGGGGVLRLLPSGQLDPSFNLPRNAFLPTIRTAALQPDGKILLGGSANIYSGIPCLLRLNADGSPDTTFEAALSNLSADYVQDLAVQPDGRILVAGRFAKPSAGLVRLLPDGQPDFSFQPVVASGNVGEEVLCRPDGRILVAGRSTLTMQGQVGALHQLLPDGSVDPTFDYKPTASYNLVRTADAQRLHLLPGGRLCVLPLGPAPAVVFLQANGQPDLARPAIKTLPQGLLMAATADSAGGMVLSGQFRHQGGPPSNLLRLRPNGQVDVGFSPQLCQLGTVAYMAEQPGQGVVLAGTFDMVNGVTSPNLARLLPGLGQVDTAFSRRIPRLDRIIALARHLPGNGLLLSGFSQVNGRPLGGIIRLQPDGRLDTLYRRWPSGYTAPSLGVQPDGRVVVSGSLGGSLSSQGVGRLLPTGQTDPSFTMFTLPYATDINPNARILVQPDGRVLLLSTPQINTLIALRVLADGSRDASFKPTSLDNARNVIVDEAVLQADGRITLCGQMPSYPGATTFNTVLRLLPSGRRDSTLADIYMVPTLRPRALCYQPDGRLLVGGGTYAPSGGISLHQYLPDGTLDPAFSEPAGVGYVSSLLRTSSGQVAVGGYFLQANSISTQHFSLLALTAASALAAAPAAPASATEVYPNPARQQVRVRPAAGRQVRQWRLLDALGRLVLDQPVAAASAEPIFDTSALPRGSYLLRLEYAQGSATTHRLVLE